MDKSEGGQTSRESNFLQMGAKRKVGMRVGNNLEEGKETRDRNFSVLLQRKVIEPMPKVAGASESAWREGKGKEEPFARAEEGHTGPSSDKARSSSVEKREVMRRQGRAEGDRGLKESRCQTSSENRMEDGADLGSPTVSREGRLVITEEEKNREGWLVNNEGGTNFECIKCDENGLI